MDSKCGRIDIHRNVCLISYFYGPYAKHAYKYSKYGIRPCFFYLSLSHTAAGNLFCTCLQHWDHSNACGTYSRVISLRSKFLCCRDFRYLKSVRYNLKVSLHRHVCVYKFDKYIYSQPSLSILYTHLYWITNYPHVSAWGAMFLFYILNKTHLKTLFNKPVTYWILAAYVWAE